MSYTPGPWTACLDGKCQCKTVMSDHHPVASVTSGEWGDEFPDIRLCKREDVIGQRAEAYIERIVYGSVKEETAEANARLIAAAPDLLALVEQVEWLEVDEGLQGDFDMCPICYGIRQEGHADGCKLQATLARVRGEE